ncbi:MAG: hypothetical protein KIT14_22645 [bacterium]|nr:hypothetical protein [bacterium]
MTAEGGRPAVPEMVQPQLPSVDDILDAATTAPLDLDGVSVRLEQLKEFVRRHLRYGLGKDYGPPFPGSKAIQLYTDGADKLCNFFRVYPRPRNITRVEQWGLNGEKAFLHFEDEIDLVSLATGRVVSIGIGSCNSLEEQFRYRKDERTCPECNEPAIIRSKYPDRVTGEKGWYCNRNKGGCGAQFEATDKSVADQDCGRVENPNIPEEHHNIRRKSVKRGKVHAVVQMSSALGLLMEVGEETPRRAGTDGTKGDAPRGAEEQPTGATKTSSPLADIINADQRKQFTQAFTAAGHTATQVRAWLLEAHQVDMSRGIPKALFDTVLKRARDAAPLSGEPF